MDEPGYVHPFVGKEGAINSRLLVSVNSCW